MPRVIGISYVALSLIAIVVSLGMPGVGWVTAAFLLVLGSAFARYVGGPYLVCAWNVSLVHLFTFGPMPGFRWAPDLPKWFALIFVLAPILAVPVTIFSLKRNRGRHCTGFGDS